MTIDVCGSGVSGLESVFVSKDTPFLASVLHCIFFIRRSLGGFFALAKHHS